MWGADARDGSRAWLDDPRVDILSANKGDGCGLWAVKRIEPDQALWIVECPFISMAGRGQVLGQALSAALGGSAAAASEVMVAAGVDPTARGEQLTIDQFVAIARAAG